MFDRQRSTVNSQEHKSSVNSHQRRKPCKNVSPFFYFIAYNLDNSVFLVILYNVAFFNINMIFGEHFKVAKKEAKRVKIT